jgi:hypothetical protein
MLIANGIKNVRSRYLVLKEEMIMPDPKEKNAIRIRINGKTNRYVLGIILP